MTSKAVRVTGVSFFTHSLELKVDEDYLLLWTISPQDATNVLVSFASDDTSVATVSSLGIVTAKKEGTARITVKTDDGGYTDTCVVTVKGPIAVEGVSLSKDAVTIEEGKTQQLYATVNPYNADDTTVTWSSSDEKVAIVSSKGLITAVKAGTATITATTNDGGYTATCEVTVVEQERYSYKVGNWWWELCDSKGGFTSKEYVRFFMPIINDGNVNIYLGSCTLDIYTEDGTPVQSIDDYYVESSPNIVKPGETGYFTAIKSFEGSETEGLVMDVHFKIKNAKSHKAVRYDVSNVTVNKDSGLFKKTVLKGKVTNNTTETASTLDRVDILLFDKKGKYMSTFRDYLPVALEPGQNCIFEAENWLLGGLDIDTEDIGSMQVFAYAFDLVI